MPPTTYHRTKRTYKPENTIRTYFSTPSDGHTTTAAHSPVQPPALPQHVQSSLLSVGMRVRKSVPEGYKTHKTLPLAAAAPVRAPSPPRSSLPPQRPAELQPFCGLLKVGGYAVQDVGFPVDATTSSSQESTSSVDSGVSVESVPARARGRGKRAAELDSEDEEGGVVLGGCGFPGMMAVEGRKIAQFRRRVHATGTLDARIGGAFAVEQALLDDFEEAGFLEPPSEDMDISLT